MRKKLLDWAANTLTEDVAALLFKPGVPQPMRGRWGTIDVAEERIESVSPYMKDALQTVLIGRRMLPPPPDRDNDADAAPDEPCDVVAPIVRPDWPDCCIELQTIV